MIQDLLYHLAVFTCRACHLFPSAWSFYVMNPRDSLLAEESSAGLRSHGIHRRLSDKETVTAGQIPVTPVPGAKAPSRSTSSADPNLKSFQHTVI